MNLLTKSLTALALSLSFVVGASATTVTTGSLTRELGSDFINDSLNHRTWLGWDATRNFTYSQALAATQAGGQYAGYLLANNADALMFVNAALGPNGCNAASNGNVCGTGTGTQQGAVIGESYYNYPTLYGYNFDYDYVFFLSNNGSGQDVGLMQLNDQLSSFQVNLWNDWSTFSNANYWNTQPAAYSIGWLMYREGSQSQVPEPGALGLLGLGLCMLGVARHRKAAA